MCILTELFCKVDDFCIQFKQQIDKHLLAFKGSRQRQSMMSISEMITLLIFFHQIRYWHFKIFYNYYVKHFLHKEFPKLPSYNRFIEMIPRIIYPMMLFLNSLLGRCQGIGFIDSTKLEVCDNKRISQHQTFKGFAQRGKSSTGWFFGFKLHMVINHLGEITALKLTAGNVQDSQVANSLLATHHHGTIVGDKGYLGKKLQQSLEQEFGIKLMTKVRKNMKQPNYSKYEQYLLKQRTLIETVFDELKNLFQIQHTRHRSIAGFLSNLISGLIAYCLMPNKPKMCKAMNGSLSIC